MTKNELNLFLKHVLTILLTLEKYPENIIDAFCQAFTNAALNQPTGSPYHALAIAVNLILVPYHKAIQTTEIARGKKSTDVKIIASKKEFINVNLTDLENKINTLTHSDKFFITETKLNQKSVYYSGAGTDIIKAWEKLETLIATNQTVISLLPQITSLTTEVKSWYETKVDEDLNITLDVSDKNTLVLALKEEMRLAFFNTCIINNKDLSKVANFFKPEIVDGFNRSEAFLYSNEYMISVLAGMMKNDIRVKFKYTDIFKATCEGKGSGYIFLSDVPNPTTIPARAKLLNEGETIEFEVADIGSQTEFYLIFAAITPGEDFILKLTVKPGK